jgi:hypothetical protein
MKDVLQFEQANEILRPYYRGLVKCLDKCIADCNTLCDTFSTDSPSTFKPRTKGSFFADRLRVHLSNEFPFDPNIRFVEIHGALNIVIGEKIAIRFNKMDFNFKVSINKRTKPSKKFLNQLPIKGIEDLTYVWGGFAPDKIWSTIVGYYLTCFNGYLNWHYDMGRHQVMQQLPLEIPSVQEFKRVKPKSPKEGGKKKTGTND